MAFAHRTAVCVYGRDCMRGGHAVADNSSERFGTINQEQENVTVPDLLRAALD